MKKFVLLYSVWRAIRILCSNPSKLFLVLTPKGWSRFWSLTREVQGKSPEAIARVEARKQAQREEFQSDAWQHRGGISVRRYNSYNEYVHHQAEKLDTLGGEAFVNSQKAVNMFRRRFELITELNNHSSVLCLGARRGEEVKAFIELGHSAIGIDLNPGKANEYVVEGDFHALNFSDNSVDVVYVNCLDHAFDLDKILSEVRRVVKGEGLFIVDIVYGYDEGYVVGNHDAMHWSKARDFGEHLSKISGIPIVGFRDLTQHGSAFWTQCVMKKPQNAVLP